MHKTLYVWETLTTITGDSQFVDQYFKNAVAEMERKEGLLENALKSIEKLNVLFFQLREQVVCPRMTSFWVRAQRTASHRSIGSKLLLNQSFDHG